MTDQWAGANRRYLGAELALLKLKLERHAGCAGLEERQLEADRALAEARNAMPAPPALERLAGAFRLSPFERDVVLLCAGVELDATLGPLCAAAQGGGSRTDPTFGLALAALDGAHWSALTPAAPLRYWHLVELVEKLPLSSGPLRIDERVLHYLTGIELLAESLADMVEPVAASGPLAPSQQALAGRIVEEWSRTGAPEFTLVQLEGADAAGKRDVAATACAALGLGLAEISVQTLPVAPLELESLTRLWERESVLAGCALLIDAETFDTADAQREHALARFIRGMGRPLFLACAGRAAPARRATLRLTVDRPPAAEQRAEWKARLGKRGPSAAADRLASQFSLSTSQIRTVCAAAPAGPRKSRASLGDSLWEACRGQSRPHFDGLARRIPSLAGWPDLVLPEPQLRLLREIAVHVRQQLKVHTTWGLERKSARGLGISALFAGESGTGKTMAAEVLSGELKLDLYAIDLSQVVNKYIGETEKNLRRVFDAAEGGGCILLFDEADALFGKRSEVRDSHDRYANVEISYLLQRMEAFRGLAILTTNKKQALDDAFLRRIRFVVQFAFPDSNQRREIWRRVFPEATPTEGLDTEKLARLNLAGGNIRNVAVYATFLAAEANEPVRMNHLRRAVQVEYAKIERPLTEAELRGWI